MPKTIADVLFILLTLAMTAWVYRASVGLGLGPRFRIGMLVWLALTATMGILGTVSDFSTMPPKFVFILSVPLTTVLIITFHKSVAASLPAVSPSSLIAFQSMRVGVEICLYLLFLAGALPVLMTPEGRNFDVLIGLTAFLAARWSIVPARRNLAIAWNILGILLLANVVIHGLLAAPTQFQVFHTDPSNTVIATFPWIWLPGFIVPLALAGHLLSLRQLWLLRSAGR